ncbi:MAG: PD-(D/E)XK nuclease-like domain-containing protein [Epibacterium sp.]|nr:PD-(D/E)XK nuclease-like domain-containing protein [Epibacterium sp.]NQX74321.1 PD-(D/E)XK nuclease-like domain-containing protein [Epibacterium sp.]
MEPGIYEDIGEVEYRRLPAVSRSDLIEWAGLSGPINDAAARWGTIFHLAMLEPHRLKSSVMHPERPLDLRNPEDKQHWEATCEHAREHGKTPARQRELAGLRDCLRVVKADKTLGPLHRLAADGKCKREVTIVWDFEGVLLKARLDQVTSKAIIDWKSTGCADPEQFAESCIRFNYHVQHGMYQDGWMAVTGEVLPFAFAASSKRPPHPCWVHRLDQRDVDHGRTLYRAMVHLYAKQRASRGVDWSKVPAVIPSSALNLERNLNDNQWEKP